MSYQVIARKYRPQRFADVVGQEHVTQTLSNAIRQNRIAHAYLFCGPRGTGKTTIARIFAKCLNCTDGPKVEFDDNDPRCREIAEGRSLDVIEIDGASNRGIDEIRELRETVKYAPATSRFKIYIIDEVHMLTKEAFNALLKTLEEPPGHVKFMFATTEPEKVLPTILSRCQRFDLRRISTALIVEHLGEIARKEGVEIEQPALFAIARGADGGMRDAESTLDQLISFCGTKIVEADALSMFGLTAQSQVLALSEHLLEGNIEATLRELNALTRQGKELGRLLSDLLRHFRNVLLYQISKGDKSLLEISEAEMASLEQQSAKIRSEALGRILEVLTDAEWRFRDAASKKTFVEVTLLKVIEARNAVSLDAVLQQLQQLRGEDPSKPIGAPAPLVATKTEPPPSAFRLEASSSKPPAAAPAPATPTVGSQSSSSVDLKTLWADLIEAAGRASPFIKSYLLEAHPVSFEKNVLTIGFDPEFADHISLVDNSRNHALLHTKLSELGCGSCQVKFIKAEAPAGWSRTAPATPSPEAPRATRPAGATTTVPTQSKPQSAPTPFNKEEFKNDPLIQKALEVFKGQIVEVRS